MNSKKSLIAVIVLVVAVGLLYIGLSNSSKTAKATPRAVISSSQKTKPVVINNSIVVTKSNSKVGSYLADPQGNTLYTYSGDSNGVSNCTGSCLILWPPYTDKGSTTNLPTDFGTIKRTDNHEIQFTFKGKPLYFYAADKTGQVNGNGVGGFSVARP